MFLNINAVEKHGGVVQKITLVLIVKKQANN